MGNCKCGTYNPYWKEIQGRQVAVAMNLDACINCGTVLTDHPDSYKNRGLGDKVEEVFVNTGIKKVVEQVASKVGIDDCGCAARRERLNNFGKGL